MVEVVFAKQEDKNYYVYEVTVDSEIRYVGKGSGDRYKHVVSGSSSVPMLNRDFFDGKNIEVFIVAEGLTEESANKIEMDYIGSYHGDDLKIYNRTSPKEYSYVGELCPYYLARREPIACSAELQRKLGVNCRPSKVNNIVER